MPDAAEWQGPQRFASQIDMFVKCVFDSDDIVEIRRLPCGLSTWHRAADLPTLVDELARANATQDIYIGANPRAGKGDGSKADACSGARCGRCRRCVALARCVFVDMDNAIWEQSQFRLRESGLPAPTLTIASGGGVHFYWRLTEAIRDLDEWSDVQRALLTKLGGDPAVHDPPRVMRLPGLLNRKYNPPISCRIVDARPERAYTIDEFDLSGQAVSAAPVPTRIEPGVIREGARNSELFRLASGMRARGWTTAAITAALLEENRQRCYPPLDEPEIHRIAGSAGRYPPGRPVALGQDWRSFPVHVLPEALRSFVLESAGAMGCDPAYVAMPALAAVAGAIGTTRRVRLKRAWAEPAMLWIVIVGHSGTLKSPAHDIALAPFKRLQAKRFAEYQDACARYERETVEYEVMLAKWKRTPQGERGEPPTKPVEPQATRYLVSDVTVEALAPVLLANPRGVLLARDELAGWLQSFDRYKSGGKGGDSAQWLEMHRAGYVLVDRKTGSPKTIQVPLAGVSVAGTIQPATLQRALGREHFENGLAARLLPVMPPRKAKQWTEADVSQATVDRFADVQARLLTLQHNTDDDGCPVPIDVPLDAAAHELWVTFYNEHAGRQASVRDGDLAAAFSKLEGYAARFALIFYLVKWATIPECRGDRVDAESIRAGIELALWFCDETARIYRMLSVTDADRVHGSLVDYIRSQGGRITVRKLMRGPRRFRGGSADTVRAQLDELVISGIGLWESPAPGGEGGAPSELFRLLKSSDGGDKTPSHGPESPDVSPSPPSPPSTGTPDGN